MGAKSKKAGNALEDFIEAQSRYLRGRAYVRQRSNPLRILGPGSRPGTFLCAYTQSESVDFEGTLQGGRAVYFDAKSSAHESLFEFKLVKDAQLEYMAAHAAMGALCFLYVRSRHLGRDYILPVHESGSIAGVWHKRTDRLFAPQGVSVGESIRWSRLDAYRVRPSEVWVDALLRIITDGKWNLSA